jgi:succinoglycan biosynthesis transport protein ExoP
MSPNDYLPGSIVPRRTSRVLEASRPHVVPSRWNQAAAYEAALRKQSGGFDVREAIRIVLRHWGFGAICMGIIFASAVATTIIAYTKYPSYEADVRVQVDPPGSETFSLGAAATSPLDMDYVDTQAQVLKSDDLALAVIRGLRLDLNPEIVGTSPCGQRGGSEDGFQLSECENIALRHLQNAVTVTPIKNTRVLELKFSSRDPHLAPSVANTMVTLFVEKNYKTRYEAVMKSSEWLERQLEDVRQKMLSSNQALAAYEKSHGIVDVDDKQSTVTQTISELNHQLTQTQADRMQLEPLVTDLRRSDPDALPQIRDNPMIQALTQRAIEVQADLSQAKAVYGSQSPNVKKLENQTAALQQQLGLQKQQIVKEIQNNYQVARSREKLVSAQIAKVTSQMADMAGYTNLKHEAQVNTDLYNTLYGRIKEAGISAASKSSNVRVFDPARVLDKPTWPRPAASVLIGLILSLFGGVGAALVKGTFDPTVQTSADVAGISTATVSMVPLYSDPRGSRLLGRIGIGRRSLLSASNSAARVFPQESFSPVAEAIRSLQTTIMFRGRTKPLRVILIVSPFAGEGKTTIAINLAMALSATGRTCLIDADLRRPSVARTFRLDAKAGLTDMLQSKLPVRSPLVGIPDMPNLAILPSGPQVPNPAQLVLSKKMGEVINQLRSSSDYVVIDSPPIIPFADARALAALSDGMILVSRTGSTTRDAIVRSVDMLERVGTPVISIVVNGAEVNTPDYQYYRLKG